MPNPGRMWELLYPGVALLVTPYTAGAQPRKTAYTAVAVERDGAPVFLQTHVTNSVAEYLIQQRRVPGLKRAHIVRHEVPHGRSRFDFLLRDGRGDIFVEVKSCTLFGNGVAMFPDAVTDRGRRHLLELAGLADRGRRAAVLFIVHTPKADWFMPDYHTDLAFAQTLAEVRGKVRIVPLAVEWRPGLVLGEDVRQCRIPWGYVQREAQDRGAYLLCFRLARPVRTVVGGLGETAFPAGHYVYVGSAMKNLSARVARHTRRRKRLHWHIDYLLQDATDITPVPIRSSKRLETSLVDSVSVVLESGPAGFGASDSDKLTHLFYSESYPLHRKDILAIIEQFRLQPPK